MSDTIQRICAFYKANEEERLRSLANSFFISADMAHAYHPNHPTAYEPEHHATINQGPVIKTNANQRYSTNADTAARLFSSVNKPKSPTKNTPTAPI